MTDDELNERLAKACGWRWAFPPNYATSIDVQKRHRGPEEKARGMALILEVYQMQPEGWIAVLRKPQAIIAAASASAPTEARARAEALLAVLE